MADGRWGQEGPLRDNRLSMKQYKCILIALDFRLRVKEDKEKWRRALAFFSFLFAYSSIRVGRNDDKAKSSISQYKLQLLLLNHQ